MTVTWQLAKTPLPSDLPFYNYGGTDIPADTAVMLDTTNIMGTAGDGVGVALPTAAAAIPLGVGVTQETIKAGGSAGRVRTQGIAQVTALCVINAGQVVQMSTTAGHLGQVEAKGAGNPQLGIALTSAQDGDSLLVLLQFANNA
jgi:hypothetical protein